jgi:hypothetical protein
MIAYSAYKGYKEHKAKKEHAAASANTNANAPHVVGAPAQGQDDTWRAQDSDHQQQGYQYSTGVYKPSQYHNQDVAGHGYPQQVVMCPLCRKDTRVEYSTRQVPTKAVFATCLACETSWKCQ